MKLASTAGAVAALFLMTSGAAAQEVAPAPNATYAVDLASTDSATEWTANDISGASAAHGVVRVTQLGIGTARPPTFSFMLAVGDEMAWLRFSSWDRKTLQANVLYSDGKSDDKVTPGAAVPLNKPFDIYADWTDSAVVFTVKVKGQLDQRFELPMAARPTQFAVYASNGEFKVDPLVVGTRR